MYSTSQDKAPSECYLLDVVSSFYSTIVSTPHHGTSHFHLDKHTGLENHYTNFETHLGFITIPFMGLQGEYLHVPGPMILCRFCFQEVLLGLMEKGHETSYRSGGMAVVQSIENHCRFCGDDCFGEYCIHAVSDGRKGGVPDGY